MPWSVAKAAGQIFIVCMASREDSHMLSISCYDYARLNSPLSVAAATASPRLPACSF